MRIVDLIYDSEDFPSKGEIKKKIKEGALYINGERCTNVSVDTNDYKVPLCMRLGRFIYEYSVIRL